MARLKKPEGQYHHGDLREALVREGRKIIERKGVEALTLREVGRRLRVSHAAPYRHFANKEALLATIAEAAFRDLHAEMREERDAEKGPIEAVRAMGRAYVRFAADQPKLFRLMFGPDIDKSRFPSLDEAAHAALADLEPVIVKGQESGAFRKGSSRDIATLLWVQAHGIATLMVDQQLAATGAKDPEALLDRLGQQAFMGFGKI